MLYNFQRDAILAVINKPERYNSCILTDNIAHDKTVTALVVIKHYENRSKTHLYYIPKNLLKLEYI